MSAGVTTKVLTEPQLHGLVLGRPWSPMCQLDLDGLPRRLERIVKRVRQGTAADRAAALAEFKAEAQRSGDSTMLGQECRFAFEHGDTQAIDRFLAVLEQFPTVGMLHVVDAANLIDDAQRAGLSGGARRPSRDILNYASQRAVGMAMLEKMATEHPLDAVRALATELFSTYVREDERRTNQINELGERQDAGESKAADVVRHAELLFGLDLEDPAAGWRFAIMDRVELQLTHEPDHRRLLELAIACHARVGPETELTAPWRTALRSVAADSLARRPFPAEFVAKPPPELIRWTDAVMAAVGTDDPPEESDLEQLMQRARHFPFCARLVAAAALISAASGNVEDARAWSRVAIDRGREWDYTSHLYLANALWLIDEQPDARKELRRALEVAETSEERDRVREVLGV